MNTLSEEEKALEEEIIESVIKERYWNSDEAVIGLARQEFSMVLARYRAELISEIRNQVEARKEQMKRDYRYEEVGEDEWFLSILEGK
jgi:hypothetical protein